MPRADSLNVGINMARYPLVCMIDADSILDSDALIHVVQPFIDDPERVVATGGVIRAANGCDVMLGRITSVRMPHNWVARIQVVEYLRVFLLGRAGWSELNSLLVISGAFGLFRRDILVEVGGLDPSTIGEDAELVVRLHRRLRDQKRRYRIVFVAEPISWTEVPDTMEVLGRQRRRWARGLAEILWRHRDMMLNPRNGRIGLFALPYYLLFEMLAPVIEVVGLAAVAAGIALGAVNLEFGALYLAATVIYAMTLSIASLLIEEVSFHRYGRWRDLAVAAAVTLVGNLQPLAAGNASALTDMVDAETGLRGFELTGRQAFLQPYRQGTADFPRAVAAARNLARGDRAETVMLDAERVAADHWIIGYAEPRVSGRTRSSAEGVAAGKALFDRFRATNAQVAASVQARIAAARSGADLAQNVALGVLAALLALTVGAGTYTGLRLLRRVVPPLEAVTGAILRLAGGESRLDVAEEGTAELVALSRAVKHLDRENMRRQLEDRRRQRLRVLTANVAREVSQHLDLEELLANCAGIIATAFDVERVLLWLSEGDAPPGLITEWRAAGLPTLQQMAGPARAEETLQCVIDELGDRPVLSAGHGDDSPALRSCAEAFGAATMIACRSGAGDDCVATLALLDGGAREWVPEHVAAVQTVAADVAGAIRRARLFAVEQRLRRDLEALEQAQADFVATVSHELRTPLTSVKGYVELLRDGSVDDEADRDRMLAVVERNTRRLQDLVDELLTLSRIEAGTLNELSQDVAVDEVMSKVAVMLEPQAATGGVALDLEGVGAGAAVRGDPGQLEQIVVNLVSNAVKFTPPGGRVALASRTEGPEVVLTVADTGIGIPLEDQEKLGSRFFRASNATARAIPGTGLGIRIVQGLVNHHRGSIDLDSEPGLGTTWTVRLPRAGTAV